MAIRKKKTASGFTITEVVVAGVIFSLAAVGIISMVSSLQQPADESQEEISAALIGKQVLEELRRDVDMTDWIGGNLDPANSPYTMAPIVVDGISFTPVYTVTEDPETGARKVDLTIKWKE